MTTLLHKRIAQVLTEHEIFASPQLIADIEAAVKNSKQETEQEVTELIKLFCELKHQQPPYPKTPRDYKSYEVLYAAPCREIIRNANGNSANVVTRAIYKMRRDGLTCGYPKQLVTVALSCWDEMQNDEKSLSAFDVWEIVIEEVNRQASDGYSPAWMSMPEEWNEQMRRAIERVGWREICDGKNPGVTRAHFLKAWESVTR